MIPKPPLIMKDPSTSENQQLEASGPRPSDDLTIADHLRTWLQSSREGESVFSDGEHEPFRIPDHEASAFIAEFGPLHPGDYNAAHDRDWRDDFRALSK